VFLTSYKYYYYFFFNFLGFKYVLTSLGIYADDILIFVTAFLRITDSSGRAV